MPQETLYHFYDDCENSATLLCTLYIETGYETAISGKSEHVFAWLMLDSFKPVSHKHLEELEVQYITKVGHTAKGSKRARVPRGGDHLQLVLRGLHIVHQLWIDDIQG